MYQLFKRKINKINKLRAVFSNGNTNFVLKKFI